MIQARYANEEHTAVAVVLAAGDSLGTMSGPAEFALSLPSPGNREHDDLEHLVVEGLVTIADYAPPPAPVPDGPTLSDWRVGLLLWTRQADGRTVTRLADVTAAVQALVAAGDPRGLVARERLEYANTVRRAELIALREAFNFTEAEVDESLTRAHRVSLGDLSGAPPA